MQVDERAWASWAPGCTFRGELYDFVSKGDIETYGLAWSVLAPGVMTLIGIVAGGLCRRRHRALH